MTGWLIHPTCQWRNGRCDWCTHPTHTCDSPPTEEDHMDTETEPLPGLEEWGEPTTLDGIRAELANTLHRMTAITLGGAAKQAPYRREIERLTAELNERVAATDTLLARLRERAAHLALAHHRLEVQRGHKKTEKIIKLPYGTASIRRATEWDWPDDDTALAKTLAEISPCLARVTYAPDKPAVKKHPAFAIDEASGAVIVKATGEKLPIHVTTVDRVTITTTGGAADAPQ